MKTYPVCCDCCRRIPIENSSQDYNMSYKKSVQIVLRNGVPVEKCRYDDCDYVAKIINHKNYELSQEDVCLQKDKIVRNCYYCGYGVIVLPIRGEICLNINCTADQTKKISKTWNKLLNIARILLPVTFVALILCFELKKKL